MQYLGLLQKPVHAVQFDMNYALNEFQHRAQRPGSLASWIRKSNGLSQWRHTRTLWRKRLVQLLSSCGRQEANGLRHGATHWVIGVLPCLALLTQLRRSASTILLTTLRLVAVPYENHMRWWNRWGHGDLRNAIASEKEPCS